MTPKNMKALKIVSPGRAEIQTVPVPRLRDQYVLVKVKAVAINPTDWKHIDSQENAKPGLTSGCDFCGTVVALGPNCTKKYKPGDMISGVTHGANASEREDGCFGEYAVVKEGCSMRVPDRMSPEEAATTGVAVLTIALGLYQKLGMQMPGAKGAKKNEWMMVYGGSSAMGSMAIQCAVLSGYKVVTTCSPRNYDLVKSMGAEAAFDYNDPSCGKKINELTKDSLKLVFDCISEGSSPEICCAAVSSSGGKVAYLLPAQHSRKDVESLHVLGYTGIGEAFTKYGRDFPASPEDYRVVSEMFMVAEKLYAERRLTAHPPKVGRQGFEGVLEGLQTMRDGKVSGVKLVHQISMQ